MKSSFEIIADSLADNGYVVVDQFLTDKEVDKILALPEFQRPIERFKKAGIGKNPDLQINETIRGDYIQWIDPQSAADPLKKYLSKLQNLIGFLNEALFLSLKDCEVHLTVYPPGAFYKRHLDQFKKDDHRKLSIICYLNKNWQEAYGGELRMHLPNKTIDILPEAGRVVCFRSDQIEHEVLPATQNRLSLTGWMLDRLIELRHI